jgi:hypothetical protein
VVVTTISCDALILRCTRCQIESAHAFVTTESPFTCTCGGVLTFARGCPKNFVLRKDGSLIRCIVENKAGWRCKDGGRDLCPEHARLADSASATAEVLVPSDA